MIIRTETRESILRIAHENEEAEIVIVCRHAVDKHWMAESLTDSGLDCDLLQRDDPVDADILDGLLNPPFGEEDEFTPPDFILFVDEGPAIVRHVPVA